MLTALKDYTAKNGMTINTKKTQTIIFNKTGRHIRRTFYVGNDKLDSTRQYKYLGFMVTPSGEINTGLKDLKNRALRAFAKLKKKMGTCFRKHLLITLKLFKSLIEPILLYASDFWGILKMPTNNPIENVFTSFCKQLLGVQKQASNIGVLLELGQTPLMILAQKNAIKNWVRIATKIKCNQLVLSSYDTSVLENLTWSSNIQNKLSSIGLRELFLSNHKDSHLKATQRMTDIFHQESFSDIIRSDSRLRTYGILKTEPGFENYLSEIQSIKERTALTKLRLSNHALMIEKGRHQKIDKSQRYCPFCPGVVEDEKHFLLKCKNYHHFRCELLNETGKHIVPWQSENVIFASLINDNPHLTSRFVHKSLEIRQFLMQRYKVND